MRNTKENNIARYSRLMPHNPTLLATIGCNSKGQTISLWEHPINGMDSSILASACYDGELVMCPTSFYDLHDMLASHKEYEPHFIDGILHIGDTGPVD